MPIFNSNIFNTSIFNTGDDGGAAPIAVKTGTGGIDAPRAYKPTGLVPRKKLTLKKSPQIDERVEQAREIKAEVARKLALEFGQESQIIEAKAVEHMTMVEVQREIGVLLRRKIRTEEEELFLFMLLAAAG